MTPTNGQNTLLNENVDILHKLSDLLLEKETVMGKELDELIKTMRPDFEFPSANETEAPKEAAANPAGETVKTETSAAAETEDNPEPEVAEPDPAADPTPETDGTQE